MMNPLMMIPFVLGYMFVAIADRHFNNINIRSLCYQHLGFSPAPIKTLMATYSRRSSFIICFSHLGYFGSVFYPFVKTIEKNDLKEEQENLSLKAEWVMCMLGISVYLRFKFRF